MRYVNMIAFVVLALSGLSASNLTAKEPGYMKYKDSALLLTKDDGYRGIWYYNQPLKSEYVYKYSGGLGTYCSSHSPFAVYAKAVNKTFFCYGGKAEGKENLLHMVSYYDHATGMVPRPTILLDKYTADAHDNPVICLDEKGHIWIFSSAHGTARPAYISVSRKPYDINSFERVWKGNYSYPQPYYQPGRGFLFLHTEYVGVKNPISKLGGRFLFQMSSSDGRTWSQPTCYSGIQQGQYQTSWSNGRKIGTAFNMHPEKIGLNHRTNLYYIETDDFGRSWRNAQGQTLKTPLTAVANAALVHDYQAEGLKVYIQDVAFDAAGRPAILYVTSRGFETGPQNGPRTWCIAHWDGQQWGIHRVTASDNNYDVGALYIESDLLWRIIGPTEVGPQPFNPGGEIAMWTSADQGKTWKKIKQLTSGSQYNHGYCRKPVDANPEFYAFWADGHGRQPSPSRLYFCDREGNVRMLPTKMTGEFAKPERP